MKLGIYLKKIINLGREQLEKKYPGSISFLVQIRPKTFLANSQLRTDS